MIEDRTIETLDAYLRNKLSGEEREAFEQQLNVDPALKQEYLFQKALVDGIRDARRMQLKTTLNNVPIPGGTWGSSLTVKGITWLVVAAVTGTLVYYGLTRNDSKPATVATPKVEQVQPTETAPTAKEPQPEVKQDKAPVQNSTKTTAVKSSTANDKSTATKVNANDVPDQKQAQPDIQVFDPTAELNTEKEESKTASSEKLTTNEKASAPSFDVETNSNNKKYEFDYQFDQGKLILYGAFEKNLYEILEFFNGTKHTAFLYYKQNFYLLDEQNTKVTPLTAITDPDLLKKLKESREK